MAEKISVQIALEGGAEIERQLAGIGEAGKKAFEDITKAAEQAGGFKNLKTEEVEAGLRRLGTVGVGEINKIQEAVKSAAGFEKLVVGVQAVENGFAAVGRAALAIAPAVAGIATTAGAAFVKLAQQTIAFAEEVTKANAQALVLGTSIEKLDRVKIGLEALGLSANDISAGFTRFKSTLDKIDLERVTQAFKELQEAATRGFGVQGTQQLKVLEEAAKGIGPAAQFARKALVDLGASAAPIDGVSSAMQRLGITTTEFSQAALQFAEKLRQMPEGLEKNNLALEVFGRVGGPAFIQALKQGGDAVDQFIQRHQALTQAQADMASKLEGSIKRMISAWGRFNSLTLAPAIIKGVDLVTNAITALNQAMAQLTFDNIVRAAADAGKLGNALSGIPGLLSTIGSEIARAFAGTPEQIKATDQALAQAGATAAQVKQQFQIVANPFTGMPEAIAVTTQALAQAGATAAQTGQQLTQAGQQATSGWDPSKIQVWSEELRKAVPAAQQAGQAAAQAGQEGQTGWIQLAEKIREADAAVTKFVGSIVGITWDAISGAGVMAWNALTSAIGNAIDAFLRFIGLKPSGGAAPEAASGGQFAGGGLLGGRGSGTSDSNLAWVSRGEYITPARAVRQPGVLAFLEALRRSGGNLQRVLDGMGRFALGGMVPRAMPAFAGGGLAGGMSNVTIQFPGLPPIGGLRAPAAVVDELRKAAAMAQVRSGGRKPSRYS